MYCSNIPSFNFFLYPHLFKLEKLAYFVIKFTEPTYKYPYPIKKRPDERMRSLVHPIFSRPSGVSMVTFELPFSMQKIFPSMVQTLVIFSWSSFTFLSIQLAWSEVRSSAMKMSCFVSLKLLFLHEIRPLLSTHELDQDWPRLTRSPTR